MNSDHKTRSTLVGVGFERVVVTIMSELLYESREEHDTLETSSNAPKDNEMRH